MYIYIPYIFNATIQFRIQDILGVQNNIGSLRYGGGVQEVHIWPAVNRY